MKKEKKRTKKHEDRHHIIPSSRHGSDDPNNIAITDERLHEHYHHIFINKTPDEIIKFLVNEFWNGQWEWVKIALQEKEHG